MTLAGGVVTTSWVAGATNLNVSNKLVGDVPLWRGDGDVHSGAGGTCWADGSDHIVRVDGVARGVHATKLHRRGAGEVGSVDHHRGAARGAAVVGVEACYTRRRGGRDVDATFRRRQGAAGGGEGVARAGRVDGQAGEGGHAIDGVDGQSAAEHGAAGPAGQGERHRAGVGRGDVARAVLGSDSEAEGGAAVTLVGGGVVTTRLGVTAVSAETA